MTQPRVDTLLEGFSVDSDQGSIAFCAVSLVTAPDGRGGVTRIVVDTGHFGRTVVLREALARQGLSASDVDVLVLTHAHWDHVQGLELFDRAAVVVHPTELDYASRPHAGDFATPAWTRAVLDRYDVRSAVEGTELAPGVVVLEAPGHSAGSIAVGVATEEGLAVVAGDAIQDAQVARERRNALVFWDEAQANASVARLVDLADVIHPGHDQPFRISASGAVEHLAPFRFGLSGVRADTPGLTFAPAGPLVPRVHEAPPGWMDR